MTEEDYQEKIEGRIKNLERVRDLQCLPGIWNSKPYHHGFANGLIYALYIIQGVPEEEYNLLDDPERYLEDE